MADKLITDYPLRSAVTPELNFFADDGTQSYRITALQLLEYINPLPVGSGTDYWGDTLPPRYIWADGSMLNPTTYPALFAVYGTRYGGDGVTTFGVPDKRDRTSVGKGNMGGVPANRVTNAVSGFDTTVLGAAGGSQSHTLTEAQMPAHNHSVTDPGHKHNMYGGDSGGYTNYMQTRNNTTTQVNPVQVAYTGISIQNKGGGQAHPNMQPSITCNYIIKYI